MASIYSLNRTIFAHMRDWIRKDKELDSVCVGR